MKKPLCAPTFSNAPAAPVTRKATIALGWKDDAETEKEREKERERSVPQRTSSLASSGPTSSTSSTAPTTATTTAPAPPPPPAYGFEYAHSDALAAEVNEFFGLADVAPLAAAGVDARALPVLLEHLLLKSPEKRAAAARDLLVFAQGLTTTHASTDDHISLMTENNLLLLHLDALSYYRKALKHISTTLEYLVSPPQPHDTLSPVERQAAIDFANMETGLYLSLLFLLVQFNMIHPDSFTLLANEICACDDYPLYDASSSLSGKTPASSSSSGANNNNNNNGYVKATCRLVPLSIDLFDLVSLLAEGNRKSYPVKKLLLLLQKVLLVSLGVQHDASGGGDDCLALLKADGRLREDKLNTKSTPQDLHNLNLLTIQKYPAYYTPSITSLMPSPLTPLIPDPLSTISRRALVNGGSLGGLTQSIVQPILVSDGYMPTAIQEAVELVQDNMYIGLREVQMSREMVELEGVKKRGGNEGYDFGGASRVKSSSSTGGGGGGEKPFESVRLDRVEDLYRFLSPNIIVHVGMLIRLLYYVNLGNELGGTGKPESTQTSDTHTGRQSLEIADANRHKEVVTKAISSIILLLLKAVKCDEILKFEYLCQLLVDNNCAILILKMLSTWFQNPMAAAMAASVNSTNGGGGGTGTTTTNIGLQHNERSDSLNTNAAAAGGGAGGGSAGGSHGGMGSAWLKDRDEPQELNFFYVASQLNRDDTTKLKPEKPTEAPPTTTTSTTTTTTTTIPGSWRNFYTTINLLRILQKITKRKTHRIMALVQWKASAVLKRIIKVPNPALQLYALKLLKSQIPFMGKKWRSSNMKVITLIYMQLRPQLCEEYLSGDSDVNGDEALAQEQYLRSLIACYHHRVYPEIYPPPQPQPQQPQQQQQQQSSASIDPISGTVTNSSSNLLSNSSNSNNPIDPNDDLETMLMQPIATVPPPPTTSDTASINNNNAATSSNSGEQQEEGRGYNSEEEEEGVICIVPEFNTTPLKTKNRYVVESGLHGDGVDDYFMRTYEAWLAEEVFGGGGGGDVVESSSEGEEGWESDEGTAFYGDFDSDVEGGGGGEEGGSADGKGKLRGVVVTGLGYGVRGYNSARGIGGKGGALIVDEFD